MPEITALIADDEPGSRARLKNLLRSAPDFRLLAECGNGEETVDAIRRLHPTVVFLDVQMPAVNGFEALRRLAPDEMPLVVFVTAHDQYAVQAFDVPALHYLVKPVRRDRFARALDRIREAVAAPAPQPEVSTRDAARQAHRVNRIVLHTRDRILWLAAESIDWIEAAGNYARVHVGAQAHLIRETMATIEERLDRETFVRVHRSAIVNVNRVREVIPVARGEYELVLTEGKRLPMSRRYRARLEFLLGNL